MNATGLTAGVLMLLALAACGASAGAGSAAIGLPGEAGPSLPGGGPSAGPPSLDSLPDSPALPPRQTDETGVYSFGSEDIVSSSGANYIGPLLRLNGHGASSYAVLGFPLQLGGPRTLLLTGSSSALYVGYSDYGQGRWSWLGQALTTESSLSLPPGGYSSPGGMLYVLLVCPAGASYSGTARIEFDDNATDIAGGWNFLVWMAADNDLAPEGYADLQELEGIGSNPNVRVLAGYDIDPQYLAAGQAGAEQARFILVGKDNNPDSINTDMNPANLSFPRLGFNSADPQRLVEFIDWAAANFPAKHTALVLWNHGDGWVTSGAGGSGEGARGRRLRSRARSASGILVDNHDSGSLSLTDNAELAAALDSKGIELLLFDACNMGQFEALYEYRNCARWLVASEVLVPGSGYPYAAALQAWNAGFPLAAEDIGAGFVDAVQSHYSESGEYVTHAVFNTSGISDLAASLTALSSHVTANAQLLGPQVKEAIAGAFEPQLGDGVRDLMRFLDGLRDRSTDTALHGLLDAAKAEAQAAEVYFAQHDQPNATGLAIWLPSDVYFGEQMQARYSATGFNDLSGWLGMLQSTGVPPYGGDAQVDADWSYGDQISISWDNAASDVDLGLEDPAGYFSAPWYEPETDNLLFSADSGITGEARESARLKSGALDGVYELSAAWFDPENNGSTSVKVSVQLLDSSGALKRDLGSFMVPVNKAVNYARLRVQFN